MSKYKKNKAVALKYNVEEDASPVVIASGYGTVAEHIIDIAEKKGIPVFKDDSAASLLCMLEVGSNIPVELYEVVAAIYCKLIETSAQVKGLNTAVRNASGEGGRTASAGGRAVRGNEAAAGTRRGSSGHEAYGNGTSRNGTSGTARSGGENGGYEESAAAREMGRGGGGSGNSGETGSAGNDGNAAVRSSGTGAGNEGGAGAGEPGESRVRLNLASGRKRRTQNREQQ